MYFCSVIRINGLDCDWAILIERMAEIATKTKYDLEMLIIYDYK